jgi:hypothetical protein
MVTIQNLDVQFDVSGDGEEEVFARLFEKHIRRWSQNEEERRTRQRASDEERALLDRGEEDE